MCSYIGRLRTNCTMSRNPRWCWIAHIQQSRGIRHEWALSGPNPPWFTGSSRVICRTTTLHRRLLLGKCSNFSKHMGYCGTSQGNTGTCRKCIHTRLSSVRTTVFSPWSQSNSGNCWSPTNCNSSSSRTRNTHRKYSHSNLSSTLRSTWTLGCHTLDLHIELLCSLQLSPRQRGLGICLCKAYTGVRRCRMSGSPGWSRHSLSSAGRNIRKSRSLGNSSIRGHWFNSTKIWPSLGDLSQWYPFLLVSSRLPEEFNSLLDRSCSHTPHLGRWWPQFLKSVHNSHSCLRCSN